MRIIWILISIGAGIALGYWSGEWSVGVLAMTAVILVWYSNETMSLRELSTQPGLVARWFRSNGGGWVLILTNQGKGSALNIEVSCDDDQYELELDGVTAINTGDTIQVRLLRDGQPLNTEQNQELANSPVTLRLRFGSAGNPQANFSTEIELKNPPISRIVSTDWK